MPTKTRPSRTRPAPARRAPARGTMRSTVLVLLAATAGLAGLLVIVAVLAGGGDDREPASSRTVEVEMGEFWFEPSIIEVEAGTELVVRATNAGRQTHDLKLEGREGTRFLLDGEREEVSLGVIDEDTRAWCTVPGHLEAGMVMDIVVTDPAPTTTR